MSNTILKLFSSRIFTFFSAFITLASQPVKKENVEAQWFRVDIHQVGLRIRMTRVFPFFSLNIFEITLIHYGKIIAM